MFTKGTASPPGSSFGSLRPFEHNFSHNRNIMRRASKTLLTEEPAQDHKKFLAVPDPLVPQRFPQTRASWPREACSEGRSQLAPSMVTEEGQVAF